VWAFIYVSKSYEDIMENAGWKVKSEKDPLFIFHYPLPAPLQKIKRILF